MKFLVMLMMSLMFTNQSFAYYDGVDEDIAIEMEKIRKEKREISRNLMYNDEAYRRSTLVINKYLKAYQGILDRVLYYSFDENLLYSFTLNEVKTIPFSSDFTERNRDNFARDIKNLLDQADNQWTKIHNDHAMTEGRFVCGWSQHFNKGLHYFISMNEFEDRMPSFVMVFITYESQIHLH